MAKKLNPLTGQLEEDGLPEDPNAPPVAIDTAEPVNAAGGGGAAVPPMIARPDPAVAAMTAAAPGAKPADIVNAASGATALESQQVTTKSPTSTRVVETKELKEAAAKADDADSRAREAAIKKLEADQELEQQAIAADQERVELERHNAEQEMLARKAAEEVRRQAELAADKALADADAKVAQAQDKSINWDDRTVPHRLLGAVLRAGSVRDSLIMGKDPSQSPVVVAQDTALKAEKERKEALFKQSKEWRDALKTKNADKIKLEYDRAMNRIEMETNAQAKALLLSDKTNALALRMAKNDPTGKAWQANRDAAVADLDKKQALAKRDYAEKFAPTVQSGGTVTTNTYIGQAGQEKKNKAPDASLIDVERVNKLKNAADDYEKLADAVEKAGEENWKHVQGASLQQKREEGFNIKGVGVGQLMGNVGSILPKGYLKAEQALGLDGYYGTDVENKLRANPQAQDLARGVSKIITETAKGYGGSMTNSDAIRGEIETGVGSQSAKEFAAMMREKAKRVREELEQAKKQRNFRE